jgi:DNA-binding NarL/FixJ family response regulator
MTTPIELRPGCCAHCPVQAATANSLVVDENMPHRRGLRLVEANDAHRHAARQIKATEPTISVLILTLDGDSRAILAVLGAVAARYHTRSRGSAPSTTGNARSGRDPLSARERELLPLLAQGLTNREIAERLTISRNTVRSHVEHILVKLDANDRTQAAVRGIELGYVSVGAVSGESAC